MSKDKKEVTPSETLMYNYMTQQYDAPVFSQALANLAAGARLSSNSNSHEVALFVGELRYFVAGFPTRITETYIEFPAGSIEVHETGKIGKQAEDVSVLPYPKLIRIDVLCWAEWIAIKDMNKRIRETMEAVK